MLDGLLKTWMSLSQIQTLIKNREWAKNQIREKSELSSKIEITENTDLNEVKWIGQSTKKTLLENGIKSKEQLLATPIEELKKLVTSPIAFKWIENLFNNKK